VLTSLNEECDHNNIIDGDGCSSTCEVETSYNCAGNPSVCTPICGDGLKRGQGCDDNNTVDNDGCSASCAVESGWSCNSAEPSVCNPICGNGKLHGNEVCDDGNNND